jgi:DNA-binding CsgD family transcriptional regulator
MGKILKSALFRPSRGAVTYDVTPGRTQPQGQKEGSLDTLADQICSLLAADDVLVICHHSETGPELIAGAQPLMDEARQQVPPRAASLVQDCSAMRSWRWQEVEDLPLEGLLTAKLTLDRRVFTISAVFKTMTLLTTTQAPQAMLCVLPFAELVLREWTAGTALRARVSALTTALDKGDTAILLVDRGGHLIFANHQARALIDSGDGLHCRGAMLTGNKMTDTLGLHAAIEHVVTAQERQTVESSPVVTLSRRAGRPLLVALTGCEHAAVDEQESAAILYVSDCNQDLRSVLEPVGKSYGLSPVEVRLACLLARGTCLTEAAATMHIRPETARSYLKQIFQKTGTNRQGELVWLMLRSSARVAPSCQPSFT